MTKYAGIALLTSVLLVGLSGCYMHDEDAGMVVGGVTGALIGSAFGSGSGRVAATIGGAIVGSVIGRSAVHHHGHYHRNYHMHRRVYFYDDPHHGRYVRVIRYH